MLLNMPLCEQVRNDNHIQYIHRMLTYADVC
jgi:hypothetical protein